MYPKTLSKNESPSTLPSLQSSYLYDSFSNLPLTMNKHGLKKATKKNKISFWQAGKKLCHLWENHVWAQSSKAPKFFCTSKSIISSSVSSSSTSSYEAKRQSRLVLMFMIHGATKPRLLLKCRKIMVRSKGFIFLMVFLDIHVDLARIAKVTPRSHPSSSTRLF